MDSRVYFHQYRRPRNQNPTYKSSNVGHSITFFNDANSYDPKPPRQSNRRSTLQAGYSLNKAPNYPPQQTDYRPRQESSNARYGQQVRGQENSKLSNYGQRSLQLDQRGVYHKQSSPYNIVSLKPKEYSTDIRQYPSFSIENRDDIYYRRMNDQYKQKDFYDSRIKNYQKPNDQHFIAGKHTYAAEPKASSNPQQAPKKQYFTAKMLNHMDELQHNLA